MLIRISTVAAMLFAMAALPATAFAQYPPPSGTCTLTPSNPTPDPGDTITFTVSATDSEGQPAVGATVELTVTDTDATVTPASAITDDNGQATFEVYVGTGDEITITGNCQGDTPTAVLKVGEAPAPPETGSGVAARDGGVGGGVVAAAAALLIAGATLAAAEAVRKRA